jgi:hypothetical protein
MAESPSYSLGPLPWSEEILRKAYFHSFSKAEKAIEEHPGFAVCRELRALQLSLGIFLDSVSDLLQAIDTFRVDAQCPEFWTRPARSRFEGRELAVRRGVFAAAASALALVGHSRSFREKTAVTKEEYTRQVRETIDEHQHRFVQALRNYVIHFRMIKVPWQITSSASRRQTEFLLRREALLQWNGWDPKARVFMDLYPDGIDVEKLFSGYRTCVADFQAWFQGEVARVSEPHLSEYREYERMLKRFGSRVSWNMVLHLVEVRRLDPFAYLDRYLKKTELDGVLALPRKSRVQIDRIIEILDEDGACDAELRGRVYGCFEGSSPLARE